MNDLAQAYTTKGKIELEKQRYEASISSFRKAISLDLGNPIHLIWHGYAKYHTAEFKLKTNDTKYNEKMISIIRILNRAHDLIEEAEVKNKSPRWMVTQQ